MNYIKHLTLFFERIESENSNINYQVKLLNLQGQTVLSNDFCTNLLTLDISNQPKGVCLLFTQGKDKQEVRKVILNNYQYQKAHLKKKSKIACTYILFCLFIFNQ